MTPRTLPYLEFKLTTTPEGTLIEPAAVYIDPTDANKAEALAANALRKAGVTDEEAVRAISRSFAETLVPVEKPQEFERTVELRSNGHQQGILKIAYELAWYWLGDAWLDDPIGVAMRDSLTVAH